MPSGRGRQRRRRVASLGARRAAAMTGAEQCLLADARRCSVPCRAQQAVRTGWCASSILTVSLLTHAGGCLVAAVRTWKAEMVGTSKVVVRLCSRPSGSRRHRHEGAHGGGQVALATILLHLNFAVGVRPVVQPPSWFHPHPPSQSIPSLSWRFVCCKAEDLASLRLAARQRGSVRVRNKRTQMLR